LNVILDVVNNVATHEILVYSNLFFKKLSLLSLPSESPRLWANLTFIEVF